MNQYEWKQQSRRLMESQGKFVEMMRMQFEMIESMTSHMRSFRDYMGSYREVFGQNQLVFADIKSLLDDQLDILKRLEQSLHAVEKAFSDTNVTVNENNERTERLLAKLEAYFGTTGLDYDN